MLDVRDLPVVTNIMFPIIKHLTLSIRLKFVKARKRLGCSCAFEFCDWIYAAIIILISIDHPSREVALT
jgi:hypothetical protein